MTPQTQFTPKLQVDPITDAFGYHTVRQWDGTAIGNIDLDPVAIVYEAEYADSIVRTVNAFPSLYAALQAMLECAEIGDLESLANAAVNARKALDLANA